MFGKSRSFALAVATVGLIGFGAPMASAATAAGGPGDNGGLINVSHDQVPVQVCGNDIPVNVIGGQVPVHGVAAALGLLGTDTNTTANGDSSCHLKNNQNNDAYLPGCSNCGEGGGVLPASDNGGLVNVSHVQVPVQLCNNTIPVNVIGIQVPLSQISAALGLANNGGSTTSNLDSSCHLLNNQQG